MDGSGEIEIVCSIAWEWYGTVRSEVEREDLIILSELTRLFVLLGVEVRLFVGVGEIIRSVGNGDDSIDHSGLYRSGLARLSFRSVGSRKIRSRVLLMSRRGVKIDSIVQSGATREDAIEGVVVVVVVVIVEKRRVSVAVGCAQGWCQEGEPKAV